MYWQDLTDGVHALLPPKRLGAGANQYNSSCVTADIVGTVVKTGTGDVTIGYYTNSSESATFVPFDSGLMTGNDVVVNHGKGVRLAVSVSGAVGLRVGYAGAVK